MSNDEVITEKKNNHKWVLPVIAAVFVICAAIIDANVSGATHFAKGSKVDGIDVSGLTITEATSALEAGLNTITIVQDGVGESIINTHFNYGNAVQLHTWLVFSHIDPRSWVGAEKTYNMGLNVINGIDACSSEVLNIVPPIDGEIQTTSAYIDYTAMKVVPEVQGNNVNYTAIAMAIAEQRKSNPTKSDFALNRNDYLVKPSVVAADLEEECAWASEHLTRGIDVEDPYGNVVHLNAPQMATLVKYNDGDIEYSTDGAMAIADELAGEEKPEMLTVKTVNGLKTLNNYVLPMSVDRAKSADSILKSAKASVNGEDLIVARVYSNASKAVKLPDHIEVSTEQQTLWIVHDGKATFESPVVTGMHWVFDTPHGIFKIAYKQSPATLRGDNGDGTEYASYVNYWMPFNGGIGLHDASWRSTFGGSIYIGNGSHGCVNCPLDTVEKIYSEFQSGSIVIVY